MRDEAAVKRQVDYDDIEYMLRTAGNTSMDYTMKEYQTKAKEFRVEGSVVEERIFGLLEESGEVAGVFKRVFRGDFPASELGPRLVKELGDVLWYLSQICEDNGWQLEDIAKENIEKLESRKLRNVIVGAGDSR